MATSKKATKTAAPAEAPAASPSADVSEPVAAKQHPTPSPKRFGFIRPPSESETAS